MRRVQVRAGTTSSAGAEARRRVRALREFGQRILDAARVDRTVTPTRATERSLQRHGPAQPRPARAALR